MTLAAMPSDGSAGQRTESRRRIIVLDVIETLLDVNALGPDFERVFGDAAVLREWFSTLLLYANVANVTGAYEEFGEIAGAALDMVASARSITMSPKDRALILEGVRSLPAHADVRPGLERLRKAGFRVVTLTNSASTTVEQQIRNAQFSDLIERSFSVDAVKRFKPAPEPYRHVAQELGVPTSSLRMVAAHGWDVLGALRVGCAAAFVARPGKVLYPSGPRPDIVGSDMNGVADQIIAIEAQRP